MLFSFTAKKLETAGQQFITLEVSNLRTFSLPDEQSDGQRGGLLVGSGSGLDGEGSSKFVQHPGLGRRQTLKMLLGSTGHFDLLTSERISQPFRYNKMQI